MEKVLITGIDSFTGQYVRDELESYNFDVYGTVKSQSSGAKVFSCDITAFSDLTGVIESACPDYIIHLAAISFVAHQRPEELYEVNLFGVENLLRIVYQALPNIKKVVIASSAAVYGRHGIDVIDESVFPMPVNHYGGSKLAMENMGRTWFDRLPILFTRPFNYTGVGQSEKFLIPKIVSHFRNGLPTIELGNIDVERDFSDVRTVSKIYRLLLKSTADSRVVNICSGSLTSLKSIVSMCGSLTGHTPSIVVNQDFVRKNEIMKLRGSNEQLHRLIGAQSYPHLKHTLEWMLS